MTVQIEWERWEQAPVTSHLDQSCDKCLYAGPLLHRFGKTRQPGKRVRRLVQRSKITEGQRPKAVTEYEPPRKLLTHYAVRCQSCGEETVYLVESIASGEMTEVEELYRSPDFDLSKHARLKQPALFGLEVTQ